MPLDWTDPDMTRGLLLSSITPDSPLLSSYMGGPGVITGSDMVPVNSGARSAELMTTDPEPDPKTAGLGQKIGGALDPRENFRRGRRWGEAIASPLGDMADAIPDPATMLRNGLIAFGGIVVIGVGVAALVFRAKS